MLNKILQGLAQMVSLACAVSAGIMMFHSLFGHALIFIAAGIIALLAKHEVSSS